MMAEMAAETMPITGDDADAGNWVGGVHVLFDDGGVDSVADFGGVAIGQAAAFFAISAKSL